MPTESTNWVTKLKGKVKKHSKAGREYLKYGEKGFGELSKIRQKTARLKKKVAAVSPASRDPNETPAQKERGGYISPSKGSTSKEESYATYLKRTGKGATASTHNQWRRSGKK